MGISTMYKFIKVVFPLVIVLSRMPIFFNDYYYSEFTSHSCVKVLYMKKDKFATKIVYVQDKISPQPQKLYTGMPVMHDLEFVNIFTHARFLQVKILPKRA